MELQKAVIIDLGGSYTQQIARMVREKGVYSEIIPCSTALNEIKKRDAQALIISGGPDYCSEEVFSLLDRGVFELGVPVMAVGHGMKVLPGIHGFDTQDMACLLYTSGRSCRAGSRSRSGRSCRAAGSSRCRAGSRSRNGKRLFQFKLQ